MEARQGAPSAQQGAALDVLHVHVLRAAAQDVGQAGVGGLVVQTGAPGGGRPRAQEPLLWSVPQLSCAS